MKIALLSRWYWEENRRATGEGGPTQQLVEAVAALGHEVIVLSQSTDTRKLKKSKVGKLETWLSPRDRRKDVMTGFKDRGLKRIYGHRKLQTDALYFKDFLSKAGPFDVVWAQSEIPDGLVAGFAKHLGFKVPPILLQMQALRYRFEKGVPHFTEKGPMTIALKYATRVIANSEMLAGYLGAYTGPMLTVEELTPKVRVVYPSLHRAFIDAAVAPIAPPQPMKDRVLFLGALNQGKGALVFLNALPKTEMSKRSSTFVVIGDFTENNPRFEQRWEETQEAVRVKTLGARIEYLGKVSPYEVIRQIQLARAVILPSLFDAFSRALVEAIALGRPVVTTDKVGAAVLVHTHQCGIVIPANDTDSLAHAIDAIISPIVPFAENALAVAPQIVHELSPESIALQMAHNLSRTAGLT